MISYLDHKRFVIIEGYIILKLIYIDGLIEIFIKACMIVVVVIGSDKF